MLLPLNPDRRMLAYPLNHVGALTLTEDNEFTLWLVLQLANEGYRVWCDLPKLLGGEVYWDDIEEVIKTRTVKVLYVLFRTSNVKDGHLKELHFAQSVAKSERPMGALLFSIFSKSAKKPIRVPITHHLGASGLQALILAAWCPRFVDLDPVCFS